MREIELLLCQILNCNRADLYLGSHRLSQLDPEKIVLLQNAIKRRINGEPLQYILGSQEFMGLEFKVSPGVFIPRPETEILVEKAIDLLSNQKPVLRLNSGLALSPSTRFARSGRIPSLSRESKAEVPVTRNQKILDIGTGSGCIAVSLAKLLSNVEITAIDISSEALEIAIENATFNDVDNKIRFVQSDLFTNAALCNTKYNMIISNPPYIPTNDIDKLAKEISFEPRIALDAGTDGLKFYRKIILKAAVYLKDDGFLLMEMGFNQAEQIKDIVKTNQRFEIVETVLDYSGIERVIILRKKIHV